MEKNCYTNGARCVAGGFQKSWVSQQKTTKLPKCCSNFLEQCTMKKLRQILTTKKTCFHSRQKTWQFVTKPEKVISSPWAQWQGCWLIQAKTKKSKQYIQNARAEEILIARS